MGGAIIILTREMSEPMYFCHLVLVRHLSSFFSAFCAVHLRYHCEAYTRSYLVISVSLTHTETHLSYCCEVNSHWGYVEFSVRLTPTRYHCEAHSCWSTWCSLLRLTHTDTLELSLWDSLMLGLIVLWEAHTLELSLWVSLMLEYFVFSVRLPHTDTLELSATLGSW